MDKAPKNKQITKIKREKRKFFFPEMNVTIEAHDIVEATKLLKNNIK